MRLFIAFFPSIPLSILLEVLPVRLDFLDFTVSRSWQMILSLVGTGVVCTFWNVPVITLRASLNSDPSLCVAIPGLGVGMSQGLSGLQQAIVTLYNDAQTIILRLGLARTLQSIRRICRMYPTHGKLRVVNESRELVIIRTSHTKTLWNFGARPMHVWPRVSKPRCYSVPSTKTRWPLPIFSILVSADDVMWQ